MSGMKKEEWIVVGIAALAVIAMIFTLLPANNKASAKNPYETKTSSGTVTVEMTPVEFKDGKMYVNAKFDTHAGELGDYDLAKAATMEYNGKTISPSSATKLTGHHSSSTIVFDTGKEPKSFRIMINGIPGVVDGVFEWQ